MKNKRKIIMLDEGGLPVPTIQMPINRIWFLVKILIAGSLVWFLFSQTTLSDFRALVRNLSIPWLMAMVLCFCGALWFTAERYQHLGLNGLHRLAVVKVMIIQNAISIFMASAAGAAYFVAMLRGKCNIPVHASITAFIIAKLFDLTVISMTILLCGVALPAQSSKAHLIIITLSICSAAIFTFSVCGFLLRRPLYNALRKIARHLNLTTVKIVSSFLEMFSSFSAIDQKVIYRLIPPVLLNTIIANLMTLMALYCTLRAFGIDMALIPVAFVGMLGHAMGLLPVQVFGGIGTCDVPTMYLYGLFGIEHGTIASFLIGSRVILYLIYVLLLFIILFPRSLLRTARTENSPGRSD